MDPAQKKLGFTDEYPPSTPVKRGCSYLVVIGINLYSRCPRLYNAVHDATQVAQILTEKYQFEGGDFVSMLLDEQATRRNIYKELERLALKVGHEDNLLIYFSGHGTYNKTIDEGFWVPVDGDMDDPGSFIPNSSIIKYLKAIKALHIVVVSDACFSGALFTEKFIGAKERQENIPSRWLMSSGRNEIVSDGRPGQHSPFADSLLLQLERNPSEVLPLTRLSDAVVEGVGSNSAQLPRCEPLSNVGHQGGEFMFRFKGSVAPVPVREPLTPGMIPKSGPSAPPSGPGSGWFAELFKRPVIPVVVAIVLLVGLGWLFWIKSSTANVSQKPAVPRSYQAVKDAGEGLLVVRGKNTMYGYAWQSDTSLFISCKYQEAYAFQEGLARVRRNGKYGWIKPDSSTVILEQYDFADDFNKGEAEVTIGTSTFFINKQGQKVTHSDTNTGQVSQYAHISVSPANMDLGELTLGSNGSFKFTVRNTGKVMAEINAIHPSSSFVSIPLQHFSLAPGASKSVDVNWRTGTTTGQRSCIIQIIGNSIGQPPSIEVKAKIAGADPPTQNSCTVFFKTSLPGAKVWFTLDGHPYSGIANNAGIAKILIPSGNCESTVKVFWGNGMNPRNFELTPNATINLPD